MTIKYSWNTWAVWILTDNIEAWVALEINDTMKLKTRPTPPFTCDDTKVWSIFFYQKSDNSQAYPCYCGILWWSTWWKAIRDDLWNPKNCWLQD
jgi:hypothetical protein